MPALVAIKSQSAVRLIPVICVESIGWNVGWFICLPFLLPVCFIHVYLRIVSSLSRVNYTGDLEHFRDSFFSESTYNARFTENWRISHGLSVRHRSCVFDDPRPKKNTLSMRFKSPDRDTRVISFDVTNDRTL